ncbi:AAA family ATPase [Pseudonocardia sp. ICBG1034]|uniref:nucleotide-binding protein n=1 Tax=Pseudonocardia sp. ICBG1034 TaxID=2844381 RepID=UPI0035A8595A
MSENGSGEQPDGSVGRYVRERWATTESPGRSFGRRRRAGGDDAAEPVPDAGATPPRTPSAAERAASAPAPGRAAIGTQTPPAGSAWGSELPEIDDDLVDEIDPSTPPHGMDLSALRETPRPASSGAATVADPDDEPAPASAGDPRHRRDDAAPDPAVQDHGPDDTGLYRAAGADPEPWWAVPASAVPDDDPDADLIWRADRSAGRAADDTGDRDTTPGYPADRDTPAGYPPDGDAAPGHSADGDTTAPGHPPDGGAAGPDLPDRATASRDDSPGRTAAAGYDDAPVSADPPHSDPAAPAPTDPAGPAPAGHGGRAVRDGYPPSAGPAPEPAPGEGSGNTGPARPAETARRPVTAREDGAAVAGPATAGSDPGRGARTGTPRTERSRDDRRPRQGDRPWRAAWDDESAETGPQRTLTPPRGRPQTGVKRPRWTAPEAIEARAAQHRRGDEPHGGLDLAPSRTGHGSAGRPPTSGWRRWVYVLTGGLVNPGESPAELHRRDLVARANRPLISSHKIAMLSLKGGVGKTTVTATLGATFASHRGDRVVAVDANPDRGTLSQKIPLETTATVRHLLRDADRVRRYSDVRAYTSQGVSRLEVLASEQDPAVSEAFSEDDYRRAVDLLEHFYNLVLTDCGTGLMHSAMYGVLGMADQIVVVSSGSIDGARSASATLDWLDAHGYGALVRNAVVVINTVYRRAGGGVDLDRVAEHFSGRCRAVVKVPFDPHLEEGAEIDLERLEETTRTALLELAAAVADGFPV